MMQKSRKMAGVSDFTMMNIDKVAAMNTGRPLKERMEIPDGYEVY
jgi:hypothetical protein